MSDSPSTNSKQSRSQESQQVAIPAGQNTLVPCVDCGNECDRYAATCPHCGCAVQIAEPIKKNKWADWISPRLLATLSAIALTLLTLILFRASDMGLCLIVFVLCWLLIFVLIYILKASSPGNVGIKEHAEGSYKKFIEAKNRQESVGALLYASFILFRVGYLGAAASIAGAAFAALGVICNVIDIESLRMLRQMLLDFYDFIEHLKKG